MKKNRISITLFVLLVLILTMGISANAGFRKMPNGKYRYYISKTKYLSGTPSSKQESTKRWTFKKITTSKGTYTYCFDEKGYMLTGIKTIYTQPTGKQAGWRTYRFANNGRLVGALYSTGTVIQGKLVNDKKGTRYLLPDKTYLVKQWKCINGYWYYFYSTGYMAKSAKVGSHYVDKNGRMVY